MTLRSGLLRRLLRIGHLPIAVAGVASLMAASMTLANETSTGEC